MGAKSKAEVGLDRRVGWQVWAEREGGCWPQLKTVTARNESHEGLKPRKKGPSRRCVRKHWE